MYCLYCHALVELGGKAFYTIIKHFAPKGQIFGPGAGRGHFLYLRKRCGNEGFACMCKKEYGSIHETTGASSSLRL